MPARKLSETDKVQAVLELIQAKGDYGGDL